MQKLYVSGIVNDSIVDGPGLRLAVFMQGCVHACMGCHNSHTWKIGAGEVKTSTDLIKALKLNPLCKGVTLTGGDPLLQSKGLLPFAKFAKKQKKEIAIYTGFLIEDIFENLKTTEQLKAQNENNKTFIQNKLEPKIKKEMQELLKVADILVDGKFILEEKSLDLKWKGSRNQRVIDIQKTLKQNKIILANDERWN
jgi:anaerobic ribonucleoside-triphosphate reductase activating protein